jgi:thymidylate synthase ThyX
MNNVPSRIYALKNLPPEVVAVTFAKCSRSAEPFDQIANELNENKSAEFNEKWVVNYGHGSVAEHAFMNVAIENVSLMAVEAIQANRLASYTEKSSRYQVYNRDRVYTPDTIANDPEISQTYQAVIGQLFDLYEKSLEPIRLAIMELYPNKLGDPDPIYQAKIKSKWIDVCRFALPNAVLANLGMSANARTMEYAVTKMLSHPLEEVRLIGKDLKRVAMEVTPTLVKYADANEGYIANEQFAHAKSRELSRELPRPEFSDNNKLEVELLDYDVDAEDKILASLIYKYQPLSLSECLARAKRMTQEEKDSYFKTILEKARNIYDKPPRELEYPYYTFDILLDQGAYYDLKRNRIMTQTAQLLNGSYGFFTPKLFDQVGLGDEYRSVMELAHEFARFVAQKYPYEAQYITTKATARRFVMKMNLREAFYFIGLRSRQGGHFTYRKVAQMMYDQIAAVHPNLAKYIMVDKT